MPRAWLRVMAMRSAEANCDVVIVGAGPAGIFAALELVSPGTRALAGRTPRVVMLEKGPDIDQRRCPSQGTGSSCVRCRPCSVVSGWGGAGAFSDGKLTLSDEIGGNLGMYLPHEKLVQLIDYIDCVYLRFGAPSEVYAPSEDQVRDLQRKAILAELRLLTSRIRHLGTGRTQEVLRRMRDHLKDTVDIRLGTKAARIVAARGGAEGEGGGGGGRGDAESGGDGRGDRFAWVETQDGERIGGRFCVVAPGREGAAWLQSQASELGLATSINPVDIGVRVELPAVVLEPWTDIVYESKLVYHSKSFDDRVRTFCMCPYGEVVTENNDGLVTVNGHSYADKKTANTNFAVLVSKTFTEPFKDPISYGKYIAGLANLLGGGAIVQRLGDLTAGRRSTREGIRKGTVRPTLEDATPGDLSLVFPYRHLVDVIEMLKALDAVASGVFSRNTLLYGAEVKFYSSRLELDGHLETRVANLFAVGDGAGVTRGLAQASASGVVAAREIARRLAL